MANYQMMAQRGQVARQEAAAKEDANKTPTSGSHKLFAQNAYPNKPDNKAMTTAEILQAHKCGNYFN